MQRTKRLAIATVVVICLFKFFPVSAAVGGSALKFDGLNDRVSFGAATGLPTSVLNLQNFTIELWFMRQGPGIATTTTHTTTAAGITAVPLLTKGANQGDGTSTDINYFLGIDTKTGALAADFEEYGTAVPPLGTAGVNHPLVGTTRICDGVWYHAAATYDSATGTWKLYLNGVLEASADLTDGTLPQPANTQHAGLGAAFSSAGAPSGAFQGMMDEVRIWNFARDEQSVNDHMTGSLTAPQIGLVGLWNLDEGMLLTAVDGTGINDGTLAPAATPPTWVENTTFASTPRPAGEYALQLSGLLAGASAAPAGDYVTFGQATDTLGATEFTLEAWIKRNLTSPSRATTTGPTGLTAAFPLMTKGMDEGDANNNRDLNYFFGINMSNGRLAADFEDNATGMNHPAFGNTAIFDMNWHHVAVTYQIDPLTQSGTWTFYLDGNWDGSTVVGNFRPRSDSIQHAAIGTALTSTGGPNGMLQGFFAGAIDEVRIWKRPRTASEISSGMNRAIRNASGLAGSWSFNECCQVIDSTGQVPNGTLFGSGWTSVAGAPALPGTVNTAPTVEIGTPDQSMTLPTNSVALAATVSDPDTIPGTLTSTWSASGPGTVTFNPAGAAIATATFSEVGAYVLTLTGDDGELSASKSVNIRVNAANAAPVANAQMVSTDEDTPKAIALGAIDAEGSPLTYAVGMPAHGTLSGTAPDLMYTPTPNYNGPDSFTFTASDGELVSNVATVDITVNAINDAPVAADQTVPATEDTPQAVVLGATDVEGDTLTYIVGSPSHGSFTGTAPNLTYIPELNFHGADTFTFTVKDTSDAVSNIATVQIDVAAVPDAPVAADQTLTGAEDTPLAIVLGATDAENDTLTYTVGPPAHGTLTGTAPNLTYMPAANYFGGDSFTFTASDGSRNSNTGTININVVGVNDAPVAANDSYGMVANTSLIVGAPGVLSNDSDIDSGALTAAVASGPGHGALALALDGSFTYTPAAGYTGIDTFTYAANDGSADSPAATVTITVNAETLTEEISSGSTEPTTATTDTENGGDGATPGDPVETAVTVPAGVGGQVSIGETSATQPPPTGYGFLDQQINISAPAATPDNPLNLMFQVDASIVPPGENEHTLQVFRNGLLVLNCDPGAGTTASPDPCVSSRAMLLDGDIQFNVRTSAASGWNIGASTANEAPAAVDDSYSVNEDATLTVAAPGVLANDTDADGNTLSAVLVSGPSHGTLTLNANGSFSYTPTADYNGSDSFTYKTNDGTDDSNVADVNITVVDVPDGPTANDQAVTLDEDRITLIRLTASNVEGHFVRYRIVRKPEHGRLLHGPLPWVVYFPDRNYNGPDSFTFVVMIDRNEPTNEATVSLTITPVNDAPTAKNVRLVTNRKTPVTGQLDGSDIDGDSLTYRVTEQPERGTVVIDPATGVFTYTPNPDVKSGTDHFHYVANDGESDSNDAEVHVTIKKPSRGR